MASNKGASMYIGTLMFIIGFAMAVTGVITYLKASDTAYDRMREELNATKAELGDAARAFESSRVIADVWSKDAARALARIDALERRPTTVNFEGPKKPVLVEIVDAPVRIPHAPMVKPKLKPMRSKASTVTQ